MDDIIDLYENPNDSFEEDNDEDGNNRMEQEEDGENAEGNENKENPEKVDVDPKKPKRIGKKLFRLNAPLLKGERGISAIPSFFENIHLKGKGYEKQDLDQIMKRLEHWAHRMYPKFNFDDSLETIDRLSKKREVQNHMTQFRLGMLETVVTEVADEEQPNREEMMEPIDEFDELLDQQIASSTMMPSSVNLNKTGYQSSYNRSSFAYGHSSQSNQLNMSGISTVKDIEEPTSSPAPVTLTEEMRKKIAENRLKALEKLKAKQKPPEPENTDTSQINVELETDDFE